MTVLCFMLSTAIAERYSRGIEEAAESIATNAAPSRSTTSLRRAGICDRWRAWSSSTSTGDRREGDASLVVPRIQEVRELMNRTWHLEKEAPVFFPGERDLWIEIEASTLDVNKAVDDVLSASPLDDKAAGRLLYGELRPSVDRLSEALLVDLEFNARHAETLAAKIASSQRVAPPRDRG